MRYERTDNVFSLLLNKQLIIEHSTTSPAFFCGIGVGESNFYRGNFKVLDREIKRYPLEITDLVEKNNILIITLQAKKVNSNNNTTVEITINLNDDKINIKLLSAKLNRFWLRLINVEGEHIWGGGEQFSHFNIAGKRIPIWVQEPGVGRDMTMRMAMIAEIEGKAGAHDTATYYPQPTFISSRRYAMHVDSSAYSVLDFTQKVFHEIEVWDNNFSFEFFAEDTIIKIVEKLAKKFGHCGHLPEWVFDGAIIGLKRGLNKNLEILDKIINAGVEVSGLWSEDWCGLRQTSFGARLFWNWEYNQERYKNLPEKIKELNHKGIKFLTYNNPYLCSDGELFQLAKAQDFLCKNSDGSISTIDFGEFDCGVVDFTNPEAGKWYKERIIKDNMLKIGISGWMADFAEYQPVELQYSSGEDGWLVHNKWPVLWSKINAEAIAEMGLENETLFFMRAGFSGSQKYCQLLWAGDQLVDFSRHDGMETAICAAISAGLVGNTVSHSDVGGYTTLYGNVRSEEVFIRWTQMNAFTPVMRTHEGNRPDESFQLYNSEKALKHFAKMSKIHRHLKPYFKELSAKAQEFGLPIQRPLMLHYENDKKTWSIHDQFLLGSELLVAPVHKSAVDKWQVYLPQGDNWIHLSSKKEFTGGNSINISAPLEEIPVFYRKNSKWTNLFEEISKI